MAAMQNPSIGSAAPVTSFHNSVTTESINAERSRMAAFPSPDVFELLSNSRGLVRVQVLQRGSAAFEPHIRATRLPSTGAQRRRVRVQNTKPYSSPVRWV